MPARCRARYRTVIYVNVLLQFWSVSFCTLKRKSSGGKCFGGSSAAGDNRCTALHGMHNFSGGIFNSDASSYREGVLDARSELEGRNLVRGFGGQAACFVMQAGAPGVWWKSQPASPKCSSVSRISRCKIVFCLWQKPRPSAGFSRGVGTCEGRKDTGKTSNSWKVEWRGTDYQKVRTCVVVVWSLMFLLMEELVHLCPTGA